MNNQSSPAAQQKAFSTGKYVFSGELQESKTQESPVPLIWCQALRIHQTESDVIGDSALFPLSDLILKSSVFLEEDGRKTEAHKLYTWPRNLGSTKDWTTAKSNFLQEFVLNFPIEIVQLHPEQGMTWKFIKPEIFKKLPEEIIARTPEFMDFQQHPEQYFFLRKDHTDPQ